MKTILFFNVRQNDTQVSYDLYNRMYFIEAL